MEAFHYQNGELYIEDMPAQEVASAYGTPVYIYSRAAIETAYKHSPARLVLMII